MGTYEESHPIGQEWLDPEFGLVRRIPKPTPWQDRDGPAPARPAETVRTFYSVDRRGFYKVGETLGLTRIDPRPGVPAFLQSHLNWFTADLKQHIQQMFPDGLSLHGWQYTVCHHVICTDQNGVKYTHNECAIELVFEYVRRAAFPRRPSRYQSFFAWDSLDDAKAFKQAGQTIYRIESDQSFRADSAWLNLNEQNAIGSYSAHRYWSGVPTPTPKWEFLLKSPVRGHRTD